MVKRCKICNLPYEATKSNQQYCPDCKEFLMKPKPPKPANMIEIERMNKEAATAGLSYGQYAAQKRGK